MSGIRKKQFAYKDRREIKSEEIKRSLVHRARLRKNYFKMLEKEGEVVPEKESRRNTQETDSRPKPLGFNERAKIAKDRKEQARVQKGKEIQERKRIVESKKLEKEKKREKLSQKTRSGQPLMGPRITDLLDKIKRDV